MSVLAQFMNFTRQPAGRIFLAIVLSLLIHAVLLLGPNLVQLQPFKAELPPLTAKLEPLPKIAVKPAAKPKPHIAAKPKPQPKPEKPAIPTEPPVTPPETAEENKPEATPVTPSETSQETPDATVADTPAADTPAAEVATPVVEDAKPAHPLPKHAELTFIAYKGTGFQVGEARHSLEISDDHHYTLQSGLNTTGIASIFKTFELNQQSRGTVSAEGLRPEEFTENKLTSKGKQALSVQFDWQARQLSFSSGTQTALPEQAQDILSFLYQFSQLPLDQARLPMHVSNGKKLENYQLEVGEEEDIQTRLGKLRTLVLRKIHAPGEEGLEISLGLEYRLLPVRIRQIDRDGEIAGQLVISEIRVSEE